MKSQLDTLLREWKPRNVDPTKIKIPSNAFSVCDILAPLLPGRELIDLQRAASIEDEHHIFATFAKALTPPDRPNSFVSSLVVGEHFIHSYHLGFGWEMDSAIFLIINTYSKHDNTRFLDIGTSIRPVYATEAYLAVSCIP